MGEGARASRPERESRVGPGGPQALQISHRHLVCQANHNTMPATHTSIHHFLHGGTEVDIEQATLNRLKCLLCKQIMWALCQVAHEGSR